MKFLEMKPDILLALDVESLAEILLRTYADSDDFHLYNVWNHYQSTQLVGADEGRASRVGEAIAVSFAYLEQGALVATGIMANNPNQRFVTGRGGRL